MISYVVFGGGVGLYFDNYDVFLFQGYGCWCWKVGQMCSSDSLLCEYVDLCIFVDFEQSDEWVLEFGDMFYLFLCFVYYGIVEDECMIYLIGFCVFSVVEVLIYFIDFFGQFFFDEECYIDVGL